MAKTKTPAETARAAYDAECAEIRATTGAATREQADALTAACKRYEAAMVADIGPRRAARKGAGY